MQFDEKIVDYQTYCPNCVHAGVKETDDPCNECLTTPVNLYSHKPVKYEEDISKKKSGRYIWGKSHKGE